MTDKIEKVRPTILPPDMRGVMFISGYRGTGKSYLASQADLPQNIAFFDFENKGEGINSQLKFGSYIPVMQMADDPMTSDPTSLFKTIVGEFEKIKPGTTVVVLDNISPLEMAINAEVTSKIEFYAKKYAGNVKNMTKGSFGGTHPAKNHIIHDICNLLHTKGVQLIIATSHIKPRWGTSGPIPNKYLVKGGNKWQDLSILTLILFPGKKFPVPSALVQKEQLGNISIPDIMSPKDYEAMMRGESGHTINRRLPPKIESCTFQEIRRYLSSPADMSNLKDHEMATKDESDPFSEGLSKEQFKYMQDSLEFAKKEREEEERMVLEEQNQVKVDQVALAIEAYVSGGGDVTIAPPLLQIEIAKQVPGVSISDIISALSKLRKS